MCLPEVKDACKSYREKDTSAKESVFLYNELIVSNCWGPEQADKGPFTPAPRTGWPKDIQGDKPQTVSANLLSRNSPKNPSNLTGCPSETPLETFVQSCLVYTGLSLLGLLWWPDLRPRQHPPRDPPAPRFAQQATLIRSNEKQRIQNSREMHSHTSQSCHEVSSFSPHSPGRKEVKLTLKEKCPFWISYHGNTGLVSLGHLPLGLAPASW